MNDGASRAVDRLRGGAAARPDARSGTAAAVVGKLSAVRESPRTALRASALHMRKTVRLAREGRFSECRGYLEELLLGRNGHYQALQDAADGEYAEREVMGNRLRLDAFDPGVARTLLAYGAHEQRSTDAFAAELRALRDRVDGPVTMLDVGANVGYFTLLAARTLGERSDIYAVEPEPENLSLLEANVRANGYSGVVDTTRRAIGGSNGPVDLHISDYSNRHAVGAVPEEGAATYTDGGRETVEQRTVARFFEERSIDPATVNAARMDVEGYEHAVVDGMRPVLDGDQPLVLHVELHPALDDQQRRTVIDALRGAGLEVVAAVADEDAAGVQSRMAWHGVDLDVDSFEGVEAALRDGDAAVELVCSR
ncbi:hypothetical protein BRC94_02170 [Halobacteriales archaeon QS_5_70_17]|nr:MAG: hypothetical protein BRC94_02170 [Halobacteriales archaeon QS_5_70_17]